MTRGAGRRGEGLLAYAACRRPLHGLGLLAGTVSVAAFLAVALAVGHYNAALSTVVKADVVALALLAAGALAHARTPDAP